MTEVISYSKYTNLLKRCHIDKRVVHAVNTCHLNTENKIFIYLLNTIKVETQSPVFLPFLF